MEFTNVKVVSDIEEKSVQQVEGELLDKHEQKLEGTESVVVNNSEEETTIDSGAVLQNDLKEEDVLSFMRNRYGNEINSLDDLTQAREENSELPEDVAAYYKYKKETGRGIKDFVKLNEDFDAKDPDRLLKEYLTATEKGLDAEDIDSMMEDYSYDEDLDDESDIRKIKLLKKKTIAKAKDFFESEKEKYGTSLESSGLSFSSEEQQKELTDYKQFVSEAKTKDEEILRKADWYKQKTSEVFGSEFKGFEFIVDGDKKVNFKPGETSELLNKHQSPQNFVNDYLDEDGMLSDSVGYHKSLAVAMNPDKFAKFFYEQGKAFGKDDVIKQTKNVNMSSRNAPEFTSQGGTQVRAINPSSGRGLKIKSNKK